MTTPETDPRAALRTIEENTRPHGPWADHAVNAFAVEALAASPRGGDAPAEPEWVVNDIAEPGLLTEAEMDAPPAGICPGCVEHGRCSIEKAGVFQCVAFAPAPAVPGDAEPEDPILQPCQRCGTLVFPGNTETHCAGRKPMPPSAPAPGARPPDDARDAALEEAARIVEMADLFWHVEKPPDPRTRIAARIRALRSSRAADHKGGK